MTDFQRTMTLVAAETQLAKALEDYRRARARDDRKGMAEAHKRSKEARHAILRAGSERN